MGVTSELMNILACPKCKGPVESDNEGEAILCQQCRLIYPIRDDIPVMLIDEAESF
jgi:uncharacterized protein